MHEIYVSFSGGKDSTVLLHLVRSIFPNTPAMFVDTGLEYPELKEFVKTIDNVITIRPEISFRKVLEKYGYPILSKNISRQIGDVQRLGQNCWAARCFDGRETGMYNMRKWKYVLDAPFKVSNKCCDVMKKQPAHKFTKQSGLKPIIGTMACESRQRKTEWLHNGCNAFDSKDPKSLPLSFWTEQDILAYIKKYNLSYASVYGDIIQDEKGKYQTTGCQRTGCIFCAYGCHLEKEPNRFQRLKITHLKLWEYCMKPWSEGGLGMKKVLDFIGIKTE